MNNRQSGRRRGRNNQRPQGGQGRNQDQGNRIDSRARGNAAQLLEKYRNMARDAQLSGDRVMTEYYLQFADHYFRVLSDARARQEEQRARYEDRDDGREPRQQVETDSAEAEGEGDELDAIDSIGRAPRNRDRVRTPRARDEAPRARDEAQPRQEATRQEATRDVPVEADGNRTGNMPGDQTPDEERPARRTRRPRAAKPETEDDAAPLGIDVAVLPPAIGIEPAKAEAPAAAAESEAAPAPRRRGRPRKVVPEGEGAAA